MCRNFCLPYDEEEVQSKLYQRWHVPDTHYPDPPVPSKNPHQAPDSRFSTRQASTLNFYFAPMKNIKTSVFVGNQAAFTYWLQAQPWV